MYVIIQPNFGNRGDFMADSAVSLREENCKLTAEEVLIALSELLITYVEELRSARLSGENGFLYGEQTAYTECLEFLSQWEGAALHGLDFDVEARFPL